MVFNWFRRQFDTKDATSKSAEQSPDAKTPPEEKPPAEPQPSESEPSPPDPTAKDASADQYLQWAKTAYQNLQTQQQKQSQGPASPAEPELESPPPDPTALNPPAETEETGVEALTEPETWADPEIGSVISQDSPELASNYVPEIQAEEVREPEEPESVRQARQALAAEEAEEAAETTTAAPKPVWAQSQAERQARIDRLKETAREEPEPAGTPSEGVGAEQSGMVFDEMFMWSAEVLANQGRRPEDVAVEEITWLQKLWQGLGRTRRNLLNQLKAIVGQGPLNDEAVEEIESLLLQADVGIEATDTVIAALQ